MGRKIVFHSRDSARQKASDGDLLKQMRELISLREKLAQAELIARARGMLTVPPDDALASYHATRRTTLH
jgi:hypothetical protein